MFLDGPLFGVNGARVFQFIIHLMVNQLAMLTPKPAAPFGVTPFDEVHNKPKIKKNMLSILALTSN